MHVDVIGGGPAGSSAALAALRSGATARIFELSRFPRHKVCGEFLSPEIAPLLDHLGVLDSFLTCNPARITHLRLHVDKAAKWTRLPEPAWGLSRYAVDQMLLQTAINAGAVLERTAVHAPTPGAIWCCGRQASAQRGDRLFGFKAHFIGPHESAVELYFNGSCYVGINAVENGVTNVCGLAPESLLNQYGFAIDDLVEQTPILKERLTGLRRSFKWLVTGPLIFEQHMSGDEPFYRAGDSLSFIDPFTGSGIVTAILTGSLAGEMAAHRIPPARYHEECARRITKPFWFSSRLRELAGTRIAAALLPFVPGDWLYRWTRPKVA